MTINYVGKCLPAVSCSKQQCGKGDCRQEADEDERTPTWTVHRNIWKHSYWPYECKLSWCWVYGPNQTHLLEVTKPSVSMAVGCWCLFSLLFFRKFFARCWSTSWLFVFTFWFCFFLWLQHWNMCVVNLKMWFARTHAVCIVSVCVVYECFFFGVLHTSLS